MSKETQSILNPWEVEAFVQNLQRTDLEDVGTKTWFEYHKRLMLLNEQSVFEVSGLREESVKEWLVNFQKIPILIYEAIQIALWKRHVYPLLVEQYGEPANTFIMFSVFYHEEMAVTLLENVLYHADGVEGVDDACVDLIDYAVNYVTLMLYGCKKITRARDDDQDSESCLDELALKRSEIEFDLGMRCVSILRYLAEYADNLPLCALSRMLATNDVPYLFAQLVELQPWKKKNDKGEIMVYNGKWDKLENDEYAKVSKFEGQAWFGLRELLLNPKCSPYYEITEVRLSQLSKLQKYMHEQVLDQMAPLIDLRRWLGYLNVSSQASNSQPLINVEVIPEISSSIQEKYKKRWKRLAEHQAKTLFSKDIEHIKSMAQILSEAYDFDKLDCIDAKKCFKCKNVAKQRCSKCKEAWYCKRECQVKDWANHKTLCEHIVRSKEECSKKID